MNLNILIDPGTDILDKHKTSVYFLYIVGNSYNVLVWPIYYESRNALQRACFCLESE